VEIKFQLDETEGFIADLIAYSTCFGHHYAHHQELKSIIQWLLSVIFGAVVFKLFWCRAEGYVSGLQDAADEGYVSGLQGAAAYFRTNNLLKLETYIFYFGKQLTVIQNPYFFRISAFFCNSCASCLFLQTNGRILL